jgi:hypothetical protein
MRKPTGLSPLASQLWERASAECDERGYWTVLRTDLMTMLNCDIGQLGKAWSESFGLDMLFLAHSNCERITCLVPASHRARVAKKRSERQEANAVDPA